MCYTNIVMTKTLSEQLCEICGYKPVIYTKSDELLRCYYCDDYVWHRLEDGDERLSCGKDGKEYSCNKIDNIKQCDKNIYVLPNFEHNSYNFTLLLNIIYNLKLNKKLKSKIVNMINNSIKYKKYDTCQANILNSLIDLLSEDIKLKNIIVRDILKVYWEW